MPNAVVKLPIQPLREIEGHSQCVHIWRPADPARRSARGLVYVHGGGFQFGDPTEAGGLAAWLAEHLGITTFSVSYRLGTPEKPSYPAPLEDIEFAWNWITAHAADYGVDPARLAMGGSSAGGCLSSLALVQGRVSPSALVALWAPLDFVARWFDLGETAGAEPTLLGCTYTENPARYHQLSPLAHVREGMPPALFIYGRHDTIVHPRQGQLAHAAWQAAGSHSEFMVLANVGHGVVGEHPEAMEAVFRKTAAFLDARMDRGAAALAC